MIDIDKIKQQKLALSMLGKITIADAQAQGGRREMVIQRVKPGLGNMSHDPTRTLQLRANSGPTMPPSQDQLARRAWHRAGTTQWHTLTDAERQAWRRAAGPFRRTGYTHFLSLWMHAFSPESTSMWDNGETVWDVSITAWDDETTAWDDGATDWDPDSTTWD